MKKLIALLMAMALIFALVLPASAVTTMRWDWKKAQTSVNTAAADLVREETESAEIPEYIVAEEPETAKYTERAPEMVEDAAPEHKPDWQDWFRSWMHRLHFMEG